VNSTKPASATSKTVKASLLPILQVTPLLRDILVDEFREGNKGFLQRVLIHLRVPTETRPIVPRVLGGPHFRGVHQLTLEGGTAAGTRRELAARNPREAIGVTEELFPLSGEVIPGAIVFAVLALSGAGREVREAEATGAEGRREARKEVERAGRKVLVIRGKGEVGTDAAVGEDDGTAFEHVEAVGGRRGWAERGRIWEGEGEKRRVIRWVFGAMVRVRVGFGLGFG